MERVDGALGVLLAGVVGKSGATGDFVRPFFKAFTVTFAIILLLNGLMPANIAQPPRRFNARWPLPGQ